MSPGLYAATMTRSVLMCRPEHYRIDYEINPWMRRANAVDAPLAARQWDSLAGLLRESGVDVSLVSQAVTVPDMVFTANAGVVLGGRFVPSNFRFPERQPEAALFVKWFEDHDFEILPIHEPHYWEGEGDVLDTGDAVYAGFRFRTEAGALDHLDKILGSPVHRLELTNPRFYHLDTCFFPLGNGRLVYYPAAFTEAGVALIEASFREVFPVPEPEAHRFACNGVVAGDSRVILNSGCPETEAALRGWGFTPLATPMDEFIKAGGSVKCLLLTLDSFAW